MKLLKYILFFAALLLLGSIGYGQSSVPNSGNVNTMPNQIGGLSSDKWLRIPPCNSPTTTTRKHGFICIDWDNGRPTISTWDTLNSVFIPIISDSGTDALTLQQVTENGNTTTEDVKLLSKTYSGDSASLSNRQFVFEGTSITNGLIILPSQATQRFSYLVSRNFGAAQDNQGVPGSTIISCVSCSSLTTNLGRIPTYQDGGILFFEYGANDIRYPAPQFSPQTFVQWYDTAINNAISKGWPVGNILIMSPPLFYGNIIGAWQPYADFLLRQDSFVEAITDYAAAKGTMFVDMWNLTKPYGMTLLDDDSLHPNVVGHAFIASKLDSVLATRFTPYGDTSLYVWQSAWISNNLTSSTITIMPPVPLDTFDTGVNMSISGVAIAAKFSGIDPDASDFTLNFDDRPNYNGTGADNHFATFGYNISSHIPDRIDNTKAAEFDVWEQSAVIGTPFNDTMSGRRYYFINKAGDIITPFTFRNSHNISTTANNSSDIDLVSTNGTISNPSGTINFIEWNQATGLTPYAPNLGSTSGSHIMIGMANNTLAKTTQIAQTYIVNLVSDLAALAAADATKWSRSGNNITANDFIGTTNNTDLIFRTANTEKARIDSQNASFIINSAISTSALPTASIEAKAISASVNGFANMYNSAGTLYARMLELSTAGSGGLLFDVVRPTGSGNGLIVRAFGNAGYTAYQFRGQGGTTTTTVAYPSTDLVDFTHVTDGAGTVVNDFKITATGVTTHYNPTNANSVTETVSSAGVITRDATGASASHVFSDPVSVPDLAFSSAWDGSVVVPTRNAVYDMVQASANNATLVGGTIAVANTAITANSIVVTSYKTVSGTAGILTYTLNAGVGFTINSTSGTDASVVSYYIRY